MTFLLNFTVINDKLNGSAKGGIMKVYLASKSPRRFELLKSVYDSFEVVTADIDEVISSDYSVEVSVMSLSFQKAVRAMEMIGDIGEEYMVISADTVVYLDGVLTKPVDVNDARNKLKQLSGNQHEVYTGFSVITSDGKYKYTDFESTRVWFKQLSTDEMETYLKTDEPYDKAGGYAIQGKGALFIEKIEGDFYNVVGLPLCKLNKVLMKIEDAYEAKN